MRDRLQPPGRTPDIGQELAQDLANVESNLHELNGQIAKPRIRKPQGCDEMHIAEPSALKQALRFPTKPRKSPETAVVNQGVIHSTQSKQDLELHPSPPECCEHGGWNALKVDQKTNLCRPLTGACRMGNNTASAFY